MTANNRPADCVCNLGHCAACLRDGIVCDRLGCKSTRVDGKPCPGRVPPPPPSGTRRAPAMPEPELVDEPAPTPRVCTTSDGLIDALRASTEGPGARALAHAKARPFDADHKPGAWKMPLDECRARTAKIRASTESYPARALTLDDLDAHERPRYSVMRSRA